MKKIILAIAAVCLTVFVCLSSEEPVKPNRFTDSDALFATPALTVKYASRDTCDLYLDFYPAADSSVREIDGHSKPAIIFAFGGGFIGGERNRPHYRQWIKVLNDEGYPVFSVDYRLGLKGQDTRGLKMITATRKAIEIGVEDVFAATAYIIDNAGEFGVDPGNLVISGSSAGAIIALQSEYELCNDFTDITTVLPDGFHYSGVISFSGAIYSTHGKVAYAEEPCPQLLMHGTADKVVDYKQIKIFRLGFFGSSKIVERLKKIGYEYNIIRYEGHGHDIADNMYYTLPDQLRFLETNVTRKIRRNADVLVDDPDVPAVKAVASLKELYN